MPVGMTLPYVVATGVNGQDRRLGGYRVRPLVINVGATWCVPCREEAASLDRLDWQPSAPFAVIGISTDEYHDRALGWLPASHAMLKHYIDHDLQWSTCSAHRSCPGLVCAQGSQGSARHRDHPGKPRHKDDGDGIANLVPRQRCAGRAGK
jgi:hypothetical protein